MFYANTEVLRSELVIPRTSANCAPRDQRQLTHEQLGSQTNNQLQQHSRTCKSRNTSCGCRKWVSYFVDREFGGHTRAPKQALHKVVQVRPCTLQQVSKWQRWFYQSYSTSNCCFTVGHVSSRGMRRLSTETTHTLNKFPNAPTLKQNLPTMFLCPFDHKTISLVIF